MPKKSAKKMKGSFLSRPLGNIVGAAQMRRKAKDPKAALEACGKILNNMMKSRKAEMFLEPVDAVALGIPDYHHIVKNPMDYGTIRKRLESGQYRNELEFAADMQLVTDNCVFVSTHEGKEGGGGENTSFLWWGMGDGVKEAEDVEYHRFNEEESEIAKMAMGLRDKFQRAFREAMSKLEQEGEGGEAGHKYVEDVVRENERIVNEAVSHFSGDVPEKFEFQERLDLNNVIRKLPTLNLGGIVSILVKDNPSLVKEDQDFIDVDLNRLSNDVVKKLYAYTHSILSRH